MCFFMCIILLPYYSLYIEKTYTSIQQFVQTLIHWKNLYVNVIICTNIDILIKLIYRTHIYTRTWYNTYTCVHVRTRTHVHAHTRIYIYTLYIYIFLILLCKNCTKIHLNYLMYHFNFNTLTICVSLCYIT